MKKKESDKRLALQETIKASARMSLAIIGMSFVRHGSGRFFWLGPPPSKKR